MLEVLAVLEAACAKLATRRMSLEDRQILKTLHASAKVVTENEDPAGYEPYNQELHSRIYSGALNSYLISKILSIRRRTKVYRRNVFQEPGRIKTSYAEHGLIVDAIVAGNGDDATRHMLAHISDSSGDFLELLARAPGHGSHAQGEPKAAGKRRGSQKIRA